MSIRIDKIDINIDKLSKNDRERLLTILKKLPLDIDIKTSYKTSLFYCIQANGQIGEVDEKVADYYHLDKIGNLFETIEEAKQTVDKIKILTMFKGIDDKYSRDGKLYVLQTMCHQWFVTTIDTNSSSQVLNYFYFHSENAAKEALATMNKEQINSLFFENEVKK